MIKGLETEVHAHDFSLALYWGQDLFQNHPCCPSAKPMQTLQTSNSLQNLSSMPLLWLDVIQVAGVLIHIYPYTDEHPSGHKQYIDDSHVTVQRENTCTQDYTA